MRVLIVDDELQMAEALQRGLEREGYSTLLAYDGERALDLARTVDHDLLVLDWMLPKVDGSEVARRLREAGIGTPILMLTARDAPPDVVEGLDCGADDYLIKPFAFEVLLARLRALARRTPVTRPPKLRVADLVLDPAARTVINTLDAFIHLLRTKVDVSRRNKLIHTVRGVGYCLKDVP